MSEENIKDFINDVSDGELSAANDKFEKIMNSKVADALEQQKEKVSKTLFKNKEQEENTEE